MKNSTQGNILLILLCICFPLSRCWDSEDLEMFDLVEELDKNFYELLGVTQDAEPAEIRKAYRKLSVKLHPDKNKEENAEDQFRKLVAVYEVLKDSERRKKYDQVLQDGLPDWKQPVYYYRRVRKMGLVELGLILSVIITIGHFIVIWTIYFERRFELEEVFNSRKPRKKPRRQKASAQMQQQQQEEELQDLLEEELACIPKPSWTDLMPFKIIRGMFRLVTATPLIVKEIMEKRRAAMEVTNEDDIEEEEKEKKKKRRYVMDSSNEPVGPIEEVDSLTPVIYTTNVTDIVQQEETHTTKSGAEWTDDDISLLAKAVAKFPSGTPKRWEKIADMVERSVGEVTSQAKKIKSGYAVSVDPAAQGITGSNTPTVSTKKGVAPSDNIVSTRSDWEEGSNNSASQTTNQKQKSTTNSVKSDGQTAKAKPMRKLIVDKEASVAEQLVMQGAEAKKALEKDKDLLKINNKQIEEDNLVWTQNQQKILEWALSQIPKSTPNRWEKIAEHIPGKSKDDCILRFKYLAEMVKKRKQEAQSSSASS